MFEADVTWYDRHFDPSWRETLVTAAGTPIWAILPQSTSDLRPLGGSYNVYP